MKANIFRKNENKISNRTQVIEKKRFLNARGSVISLTDGFLCCHISLIRCAMFTFGGRKLAFVFRKSPSSLNEFIGYVELTDFCEIWPELALMTKEQKRVGEFFYFKYFSRGGLWRITFWELFDAGTWEFHKKMKVQENADTLWEIDALWLTLHSYFASTIAFHTQ